MTTGTRESEWRVLCTDAMIILADITRTHRCDPLLVDEWRRRYLHLATAGEDDVDAILRQHVPGYMSPAAWRPK